MDDLLIFIAVITIFFMLMFIINNKILDKDVITVKTYKHNYYGSDVVCNGATRIVYRPDKPLSCGAKVWIEALGDVTVIGKDNQPVTI